MPRALRVHLPYIVLTVTTAAALTACGSSSSGGGSSAATSSASSAASTLSSLVPESIRSAGVLNVGTPATSQPASFLEDDGKTPQGAFVDLVNAAAQQLGLKANVQVIPFSGLLPALSANKVAVAGGNVFDTVDRENSYTLIAYQKDFDAVLVGSAIKSTDDLCGTTVGAVAGGTAIAHVQSLSDKCASSGKTKITVRTFPSLPEANTALTAGQIQAATSTQTTANYLVQTALKGKNLHVVPLSDEQPNVYALAVTKDNTDLAKALAAAVQQVIKSGQYKTILTKWDSYSTDGALSADQVGVNQAAKILGG